MIFGIPHVGRSTTTEEFAHSTRENLQIAFELARRNLSERDDKQNANNSKLTPTRYTGILPFPPPSFYVAVWRTRCPCSCLTSWAVLHCLYD